MKIEIIEEILRLKLLMGYDLSKTNEENLLEQSSYAGTGGYVPSFKSDEEIETNIERQKNEKLKEYPNYCKYPEKAITPPAIKEKNAEGVDALIDGYCYYPPGVFIPKDSYCFFWTPELVADKIIQMSKEISFVASKKTKEVVTQPKYSQDQLNTLIMNMTNSMPMGQVAGFKINNEWFTTKFYVGGDLNITWGGFINFTTKEPYKPPKWGDPRNKVEQFWDQYENYIQWGTFIATAIAGLATGGAAWVVTAEIFLEMSVGVAGMVRATQKGENVSAAVSLVCGVLPFLKYKKLFTGVSDEVFNSLSKKIASEGIGPSTTIDQYIKFYKTLTSDEQMVFSKLLKQDELGRDALIKQVAQDIGKGSDFKKGVVGGLKKLLSENEDLLTKIPFFERIWVRELGLGIAVQVLGSIVNAKWGNILNEKDLMTIEQYLNNLPPKSEYEMAANILFNSKYAKEICETLGSEEIIKKSEFVKQISQDNQEVSESWGKTLNKYVVETSGGQYVDVNNVNPIKNENSVSIEKLKSEGYKPIEMLDQNNLNPGSLIIVGDTWYAKEN